MSSDKPADRASPRAATVAATACAAKARETEQAKNAPAQVQGKLDESFKQAEQKRAE